MDEVEHSLRMLIERWVGPVETSRVHACVVRSSAHRARCVRVEADRASGTLSLFVFRHQDGSWHVFPPAPPRPAIGLRS